MLRNVICRELDKQSHALYVKGFERIYCVGTLKKLMNADWLAPQARTLATHRKANVSKRNTKFIIQGWGMNFARAKRLWLDSCDSVF